MPRSVSLFMPSPGVVRLLPIELPTWDAPNMIVRNRDRASSPVANTSSTCFGGGPRNRSLTARRGSELPDTSTSGFGQREPRFELPDRVESRPPRC